MSPHRTLSTAWAALAAVTLSAHADPQDVATLLAHPVIDSDLPLSEVQAYTEAHVPAMPAVKSRAEWEKFAQKTRRDALDKIVFRGEAARQWRDAKTRVEWLETIEGGPGYHIRKVRYEVLPGLWTVGLLYEPDQHADKIPVHLAVNGHDGSGKAASYKQIRCINLAKRGVASLNIEWLGMGQLRSEGFAHTRMNQLDLCGVSGLAPHYLDMSRGLDVLLSLPYADPQRVAVSGLSGGGWQTITISSLDPRVTLCNPVAGYSSFRTRVRFTSDLGDSEQTPNDLATVADYAHLTAMLAGRGALLTFNARDNCCFAADHAMQPLLDAAGPIFELYGQANRLRTHVNQDPGTHNFEVDNLEALYRVVGEEFFANDKNYNAEEIHSFSEVKTAAQLQVELPGENTDFHQLAVSLSQSLPRDPQLAKSNPEAARSKLAEIVKYKAHTVTAKKAVSETRGDTKATFWQLHAGADWTVPAVELVRGEPKGTTILIADGGRKSVAANAETLLASGQRVLAIDPFYFGESKIAQKDWLYAILVAAVGDRPLGIQASEVAAVARWSAEQFKEGSVAVETIGPSSSTFALVAAALERRAIGSLKMTDPLASLHQVIDENRKVDQTPELFCFGLLEAFDVPQLKELAGAERLR
jgi:hypothetical protein